MRKGYADAIPEEAKQQVLLALEYIHYNHTIDTSFIAVHALVNLYQQPERIIVKPNKGENNG